MICAGHSSQKEAKYFPLRQSAGYIAIKRSAPLMGALLFMPHPKLKNRIPAIRFLSR